MKLTIETENPAEIAQIVAALSGGAPSAPAATAAQKPKAEKKEAPAPEPVAAAAPTVAAPAAPAPSAATSSASPSEVPDEATLTAAANAAIGKLGPGAQAKVKAYIADNYQKDDGSPAGLRTVRADQRAQLLADLQAFANGTKVI